MQKKLIVMALASAFAAPAFAATSNVDIYGQFDVSVNYVDNIVTNYSLAGRTSSAETNSAWQLNSNASRIGLKGSEDLGGGLSAIWQYETGVNLDSGTGQAPGGGLGNLRNSFVGLSTPFGTLIGGTNDTPYKFSTAPLDPFADTAGDYNAAIGAFYGYNVADLRLGNVLAYISPDWSGFSFAAATSFLNERGADGPNGNSPEAYSVMAKYANGPLYLTGAYEYANHIGTSIGAPGFADVKIEDYKFGAGYTYEAFTINAIYDHIKAESNSVSTSGNGERWAWGLNGTYTMGNIVLKVGGYDIGDAGIDNSGATMYEVGADYNLSKRSKLYAVWTEMNNSDNGLYCAGGAQSAGLGSSGVNPVCGKVGDNPMIFAIGMRHTF